MNQIVLIFIFSVAVRSAPSIQLPSNNQRWGSMLAFNPAMPLRCNMRNRAVGYCASKIIFRFSFALNTNAFSKTMFQFERKRNYEKEATKSWTHTFSM